MAGISSRALNRAPENRKKYNGIEFDEDLDIDSYEAFYRNLDPQTGRWWQIDPVVEGYEDWSPYNSNLNNPIRYDDPKGDCPTCITGLIGAGVGALIGGAVEAGTQLYQNGKINDWGAVTGAAVQGGVTGGVAGLTGGSSLIIATGASASANAIGGAANNAIQGKEITVKSVASDAVIGVAAGLGGNLLDKAVNRAEGIVYLRTDHTGNLKPYVGQAKSAERFAARQKEHARANPKSDFSFSKIDKGKPGKDLNLKEQKALDARGGPTNKSNPNGGASNKKNIIKKEK